MEKEKINFLYNSICEDEPPCTMCEFKCPYSSYEDGHYCEGKDENIILNQCYEVFKMWLEDKI